MMWENTIDRQTAERLFENRLNVVIRRCKIGKVSYKERTVQGQVSILGSYRPKPDPNQMIWNCGLPC
jgi:hypothetical protein